MKELVVVSGKGGTGKTSVVASFAALARDAVLADCDVDAADLHLILAPEITRREEFMSGHTAVVRQPDCIRCGACLAHCRFEAVIMSGREAWEAVFTIDPIACEGCGVCVEFCPQKAIDFPERHCGEWFVSATRFGSMVHARLGTGSANSGQLVSLVRKEAKRIAQERGISIILVDGPPGIGCPVIASVTGATTVLAVTEPTLSGEHDLGRVLGLARHFGVRALVCVNKWDINPGMTDKIEQEAADAGAMTVGRIPYDSAVTRAQVEGITVVEYGDGPAANEIKRVWKEACRMTS
jgi:MinD superfamily P-loop ATPase